MQTYPQFRAELLVPRENVVVLALEGEVDTYAAPEFKELLLKIIGQGTQRVIVDLTLATLLDSTALGVLASGAKRAQRGSLAIVCSDEATRRIFAIVGIDRPFALFTSRAAALSSGT